MTRDYARLIAADLFSIDVLLDALMEGPASERLMATIERQIDIALDAQMGAVRPVLTLAIGTKRYIDFKSRIIQRAVDNVPRSMAEAKDYALDQLDLEQLIVAKMNVLSTEQYESILRPIFKDDEMLMVLFGAVLGFMVGELQIVLVEYLSR